MKHSSDFTYSLEGDYAERKPQELVEAKCAWLRLLALLYLLARRFNTNQLHMEKIKTLAEAEELVKQGRDIMNEANMKEDLIKILSVHKLT